MRSYSISMVGATVVVTVFLLFDVCVQCVFTHKEFVKPCCSYTQFEGLSYQTVGAYDQAQDVASLAHATHTIHYDYDHKMIAVETTRTKGSSVSIVRSIQDYNKKLAWIITGMVCTKSNLTDDLHSYCVADNAILQRSQNIAGVKAQTWYVPPPANLTTMLRVTVSTTDCVPIHESLLVMAEKSTMSLLMFQNVTKGIRDPSVFQVPDYCQKAEERPNLSYPLHQFGFHNHLSMSTPSQR